MENGNSSSTNQNITDYSTDHTENSLDYTTEYVGDDSTGDSADQEAESENSSDSSISCSGSESFRTDNPVADNDDAYISSGEVIHSLIGVDPTLPEPPHAARPPNADDLINHLNHVIWQHQVAISLHQSAVAMASPYIPVQPAGISGHWVIPVVANAGIMPGTESFQAVPPSGGNFGVVMPAGTGTFPAVPLAGGIIPVTGAGGIMSVTGKFPTVPPAGTGTVSAGPPTGENGGTTSAVPESSSAVPPGNDAIVPNPESLSAVPPAEGNGGKVQDKKQKSVLIEEPDPSSSKPSNSNLKVLSSSKDFHNVPAVTPKPSPPVAQSASSIVAQAVAQPRVCLTLSLRDYLTSCNTTQLKLDERAWKAEGLRIFRQVVQIVHAAQAEGIVLTDMRPSRFVSPGPHLRYTGALVLAESRSLANVFTTRKRRMEIDQQKGYGGLKSQKVCEDMEKELQKRHRDMENAGYLSQFSITYWCQDDSTRSPEDPDFVQLEKKWYHCVDQCCGDALGSYNVYSLGVLLFELLSKFESPEKHSAAMEDLSKLILPEQLLAKEPEAAGFCLRLLNPATRPSTGEILDILAECTFNEEGDEPSEEYSESKVLLEFLRSLQERKEKRMARILEELMLIDTDINQLGKSYEPVSSNKDPIPCSLFNNISQMATAYFSMKGRIGNVPLDRPDIEMLNNKVRATNPNVANQKDFDEVAYFFQGVCKYAKYTKFEVCGTYLNSDLVTTPNGICSMSFDPEERLIATARVSKKIKILECAALLDDSLDLPYTSVQMNNDSMFSCVCWNPYMQNYLASADYDGVVKIWNACTGQEVSQHKEHKKKAWQVDTSRINPTLFASTSEEGTVKLWSMNQLGSTATIQHRYDICSVQYSSHSSNLMAIGSATGVVFCYDLRNMRAPWCTLASHQKPVTFVRFLDAETLVSSSTESSLKIWDLKKSSQDGPSPNACTLTLTGHRNTQNFFLGLADYDGYIACGSETNEVFTYHRSFPMPITTHAFGAVEPLSEHERDEVARLLVTSVCWGQKSGMLVAANSTGSIKVLRLA